MPSPQFQQTTGRRPKRSNDTHESKTDPESKLWRKGKGREAKPI